MQNARSVILRPRFSLREELAFATLLLSLLAPPFPDSAHAQPPAAEPSAAQPAPAPAPAAAPETAPAPVASAPVPAAAPPPAASAWTFTPSAQVRLRGEARVNNYLPLVREDEYFITSRVRVGLDVRNERFRIFAQAQDVRNLGDFPPGNDGGAGFGIHQGFAEVGFEQGYLRVGRQEINYGSERMLGALDWTSPARSFDAMRLHLRPIEKLELDAFAAVTRGETAFLVSSVPDSSAGDYFGSAQLAYQHSPALRIEGNYFVRHDGETALLPARNRTISSPTLRLAGNVGEGLFRYDVEGAVQTGTTQAGRHFAYAFAADGFLRLGDAGGPTLDGGASYATGARRSGAVDEFENMFPTNHKFYGFMDLLGLRNVIEGHIGISHRFAPSKITIAARAFEMFLQTTNGASRWSNAVGATLGTPTGGSRQLGTEADLWLNYKPRDFLSLTGGYSLFVPGAAANAMGNDQVQHWAWLQLDVFTP